eukprot:12608824-Alexandrium_andersonii.AAC.1
MSVKPGSCAPTAKGCADCGSEECGSGCRGRFATVAASDPLQTRCSLADSEPARDVAQNAPLRNFGTNSKAILWPTQFKVRAPEARLHAPHGGLRDATDCSTDGP